MTEKIIAFLRNPVKKIAVIKTRDYKRVSDVIQSAVINLNLQFNTELKVKTFIPGQSLYTEVEYTDLSEFLKALQKDQIGVVWLSELEAEIAVASYHFCQGKIFILTPVYIPSVKEDVYTSVISDEYSYDVAAIISQVDNQIIKNKNRHLEIEEGVDACFKGLSYIEASQTIWDACIENNFQLTKKFVLEKKQRIFEKDHTLQLITPQEVDKAVGLEHVARIIMNSYKSGIGKGTLLLGIAGCGKTLLAENLAREVPVIKFNLGRIYSKYVGESEERLEGALQRLEAFGEGIVFVDEIEKALASTTFGNDGGVSMRVLGLLLGWMQRRKGNLYMLGTANRLDMLPPELIRPERWDFIFGITFPPQKVLSQVIQYYAEKYQLETEMDLLKEEYITPADISSIYRAAKMTGLPVKEAARLVKRTRNLYPEVEVTLKLINKFSVPVWDLDETGRVNILPLI
jgi:AAA+ superfamily predicted ATPase